MNVTSAFKDRFGKGSGGTIEDKNSYNYFKTTMSNDLKTVDHINTHFEDLLSALENYKKASKTYQLFEKIASYKTPDGKYVSKLPKTCRAIREYAVTNRAVRLKTEYVADQATRYSTTTRDRTLSAYKQIHSQDEVLRKAYRTLDSHKKRIQKENEKTTEKEKQSNQRDYAASQQQYDTQKDHFKDSVRKFIDKDAENLAALIEHLNKVTEYHKVCLDHYTKLQETLEVICKDKTIRACFERPIQKHLDDAQIIVAAPVKAATDWLQSGPVWRLETEGLFRIQGGQGQVQELRDQFDRGDYRLPDDLDTHTVATFLKNYLRTLSVKAFDRHLTDEVESAIRTNMSDTGEIFHDELLTSLWYVFNDGNGGGPLRPTFEAVFKLLSKVSQKESVNKMGVSNLAIVFTPTLFTISEAMHGPSHLLTQATEYLIQYADYLFPEPVTKSNPSEESETPKILPAPLTSKPSLAPNPSTKKALDKIADDIPDQYVPPKTKASREEIENLMGSLTDPPNVATMTALQIKDDAEPTKSKSKPVKRTAPSMPVKGLISSQNSDSSRKSHRTPPSIPASKKLTQEQIDSMSDEDLRDPANIKDIIRNSPVMSKIPEDSKVTGTKNMGRAQTEPVAKVEGVVGNAPVPVPRKKKPSSFTDGIPPAGSDGSLARLSSLRTAEERSNVSSRSSREILHDADLEEDDGVSAKGGSLENKQVSSTSDHIEFVL